MRRAIATGALALVVAGLGCGDHHHDTGQANQAQRAAGDATDGCEHPPQPLARAVAAIAEGNLADAEGRLFNSLTAGNDACTQYWRAQLRLSQDRRDAADPFFRLAVKRDPRLGPAVASAYLEFAQRCFSSPRGLTDHDAFQARESLKLARSCSPRVIGDIERWLVDEVAERALRSSPSPAVDLLRSQAGTLSEEARGRVAKACLHAADKLCAEKEVETARAVLRLAVELDSQAKKDVAIQIVCLAAAVIPDQLRLAKTLFGEALALDPQLPLREGDDLFWVYHVQLNARWPGRGDAIREYLARYPDGLHTAEATEPHFQQQLLQTIQDMRTIAKALEAFAVDYATYPSGSTMSQLETQLSPTYLESVPLTDGWGNPFEVELHPQSYVILSAGADGLREVPMTGRSSDPGTDIVLSNGSIVRRPDVLGLEIH